MIDIVLLGKRDLLVRAVDRTGRSIHKVGRLFFVSLFDKVRKTDNIALDIQLRVLQRVSHTCLRRQMDDRTSLFLKKGFNATAVYDVALNEMELRLITQNRQTAIFQPFIIKRIEIINAAHSVS